MTINIESFGGATGQADGVLVHISELLVCRYRLNLQPLGLLPKTVVSPHGHAAISSPTIEEADEAISCGFSEAADRVIQDIYEAHAPKTVVVPKTVEFEGVAHMVSDKALETINRHQDARFDVAIRGVLAAVHESLDQQFSFLRFIDGETLTEKVSAVALNLSDPDVKDTPCAFIARELYQSCLSIAREHNGSDWALLKTDHNLANRVQASVGVYTKGFGYEL